jgi:RimJ/RimL family protein N-acetyltransferase
MEPLRTTRLVVRPLRVDDAAALAVYRSDPEVARYQSWEAPFSRAQADDLIAELERTDSAPDEWRQWALERVEDGSLVGDLGVRVYDEGRQAELGFTIASAWQRQGYAFEGAARVLDHLLVEQGVRRVRADCDTRNLASAALLERLGFRREGELIAATWCRGEWSDDYLYALLASEWLAGRGIRARTGEGGPR